MPLVVENPAMGKIGSGEECGVDDEQHKADVQQHGRCRAALRNQHRGVGRRGHAQSFRAPHRRRTHASSHRPDGIEEILRFWTNGRDIRSGANRVAIDAFRIWDRHRRVCTAEFTRNYRRYSPINGDRAVTALSRNPADRRSKMSVSVTSSVDTYRPARGLLPLCAGAVSLFAVAVFWATPCCRIPTTLLADQGRAVDHRPSRRAPPRMFIRSRNSAPPVDFECVAVAGAVRRASYAGDGPARSSSLHWRPPCRNRHPGVAAGWANFEAPAHSLLITMLVLMLSWHHLLARPHVLALRSWWPGLAR